MSPDHQPDKNTDARNREFIRYEQVEKDQDYRLAEGDPDGAAGGEAGIEQIDEQFDEEFEIRTCSMALPSMITPIATAMRSCAPVAIARMSPSAPNSCQNV